MKKLTAIFLITLFLSNVIGYRIVYFYAEQQSTKQLEASLDKDEYNEKDLITIVVPLSMPYQTDLAHFQRIDGEISVEGKIYKYVKRKVADGNLIIMCLPDYNKMRLTKEKESFAKDANNLAENKNANKQNNHKGSFKNLLSEYDHLQAKDFAAFLEGPCCHTYSNQDAPLASTFLSSPGQPPELS